MEKLPFLHLFFHPFIHLHLYGLKDMYFILWVMISLTVSYCIAQVLISHEELRSVPVPF